MVERYNNVNDRYNYETSILVSANAPNHGADILF